MEKKNEDLKALRLFAEEIERKIAHLFLLLNSAQDRLEELMTEEESEGEGSQDPESSDSDFQKCYDQQTQFVPDKEFHDHCKSQKAWDKITRPTILRSRKIPEKSGNKK